MVEDYEYQGASLRFTVCMEMIACPLQKLEDQMERYFEDLHASRIKLAGYVDSRWIFHSLA